MRWVEMKCKCEVWSVGCEECNVKCEESVCIAPGSRAGHVLGQQHCNSLAHGACKFLSSSTGKWFMKACMTYEKRWWDEKKWAGIGWEELRWDKVWRVKSAVWSVGHEECSVKCGMWNVKKAVRSEKCEVWTVKFQVWRVKCGLWSVKCGVWSGKSAVGSVKCGVWSAKWSFKCEMWKRTPLSQSARTHGLGWRTAHASSIDEKDLIYIFKATSAPPRAGTTGNIFDIFGSWLCGFCIASLADVVF